MNSRPADGGSTVITLAPDASRVDFVLAALWDVELAVEITLRYGSLIGGVLAEVVSGYLSQRGSTMTRPNTPTT